MKNKKKIKIYTVTHKLYRFPEGKLYCPIVAGSFEYEEDTFPKDYLRDNVGSHISDKHDLYSEFTALYWIWKNSSADIVGLNHYRRYFISGGWLKYLFCILYPKRNLYRAVLSKKQIAYFLKKDYDCILPKKQWRVGRTLKKEFSDIYGTKLLNAAESAIKNHYPQYLQTYYSVMNGYENYQKCICVMKRDCFNRYAEWIFSIFDLLEANGYSGSNREFAYLGERLMNVWVEYGKKNHGLRIKELFYVNTEAPINKIIKDYTEFYIPRFFRPVFQVMMKAGLWIKD